MSDVALCSTTAYCVTCVPDYFIDQYMVGANGEYVKIFLYLLRCIGGNVSGLCVSKIADALEHTEKDVRKALHYWEEQGLLELRYNDLDELDTIKIKEPREPKISEVKPKEATLPNTPPVNKTELNDDRLNEIIFFAERIMKTTLSLDIIESFIWWHDTLGLSWDLVEYIIDRCVDKGSGNKNYMNKIAISYSKDKVTTVEEAKLHDTNFLSVSYVVRGAFAISRALNVEQANYVEKWIKVYGFSEEIIKEACLRTYRKTGNPTFEYADTILSSWYEKAVKSLDDIQIIDEEHSKNANYSNNRHNSGKAVNSFHNYSQRSNLDFAQIEKIMTES